MNCSLMDLPAQALTCLQLLQPGRQHTSTLSSATVRYFPQELQTKMSKKTQYRAASFPMLDFFLFIYLLSNPILFHCKLLLLLSHFLLSRSSFFLLWRSRWDQREARGRGHARVFFTEAFLLLLMDVETKQSHQLGRNNNQSGTWGRKRGCILSLLVSKLHPLKHKNGLQSSRHWGASRRQKN